MLHIAWDKKYLILSENSSSIGSLIRAMSFGCVGDKVIYQIKKIKENSHISTSPHLVYDDMQEVSA